MGATDVGTGIALVRLNRTGADSGGDRWNPTDASTRVGEEDACGRGAGNPHAVRLEAPATRLMGGAIAGLVCVGDR